MKAPTTLLPSRTSAGPLLLPVKPWFIWFSLLVAGLLNLAPWGRLPGVPDFLALVLVFWAIHQPLRVGISAAFLFGLLMDVHDGALLGQHALAYTVLSYFAITLHRRVQSFGPVMQALHLLPLFLFAQLLAVGVRAWVEGEWAGYGWLLEVAVTTALWPAAHWLLLAPQRQPHERDEIRPI